MSPPLRTVIVDDERFARAIAARPDPGPAARPHTVAYRLTRVDT
ncbi:MAG TPA: hypothetical protein VLT45_06630 [Kofleriaceae bacterium]|nr:hypothetical protein [Kofleriaceae bacterium]